MSGEELFSMGNEGHDKEYLGYASVIAGVGAALASIIYAMKHVKKSSCLGSTCTQEVILETGIPVTEQNLRRTRSSTV
jgi:hypothetical protein